MVYRPSHKTMSTFYWSIARRTEVQNVMFSHCGRLPISLTTSVLHGAVMRFFLVRWAVMAIFGGVGQRRQYGNVELK